MGVPRVGEPRCVAQRSEVDVVVVSDPDPAKQHLVVLAHLIARHHAEKLLNPHRPCRKFPHEGECDQRPRPK